MKKIPTKQILVIVVAVLLAMAIVNYLREELDIEYFG